MSTINNALTKLAEQESLTDDKPQTIVRAHVSPIRSSRFIWAIGGFTLSLGLGAWAMNSTPVSVQTSVIDSSKIAEVDNLAANTKSIAMKSNTNKLIEETSSKIYSPTKQATKTSIDARLVTNSATKLSLVTPPLEKTRPEPKEVKLASAHPLKTSTRPETKSSSRSSSTTSSHGSSMQVQQVELTHRQMADKAIDRANKALEANDFEEATSEFRNALRFVPSDETTRRKLAALYYGNHQVRKAAELLEAGIKLDKNSNTLRLSLATVLIKEQQPEAALSALGYIPEHVSDKYLATRAALAQQLKRNDWALQSYQMLIKREPENGRWWLGLGIQQERAAQPEAALKSYNNALTMVGLSSQSQAFIRNRITLLESIQQEAE